MEELLPDLSSMLQTSRKRWSISSKAGSNQCHLYLYLKSRITSKEIITKCEEGFREN